MPDYLAFNRKRWDHVSRKKGNPYTLPISHEELMAAKGKPMTVSLTVGALYRLHGSKGPRAGRSWGWAAAAGSRGRSLPSTGMR